MTDQHPITPPPELVHQWHKEACKDPYNGGTFFESKTLKYIATQAARWGADTELEACCEWLEDHVSNLIIDMLRAARRPKPPSLKEQAKFAAAVLGSPDENCSIAELQQHWHTICCALEQLDD